MVGAKGSFGLGRVFAGVDVYNGGDKEEKLTMRAQGMADVVVRLKAGELNRVRTGWGGVSKRVVVEGGEGLRFDNLAVGRP